MLRPIRICRFGVWIPTGLPFMYIHIGLHVYSVSTWAKFYFVKTYWVSRRKSVYSVLIETLVMRLYPRNARSSRYHDSKEYQMINTHCERIKTYSAIASFNKQQLHNPVKTGEFSVSFVFHCYLLKRESGNKIFWTE